MSNLVTKALQDAYFQDSDPVMFFTGMFNLRSKGIHNSSKVEIDIKRMDEDVSIAVQDLRAGYRENSTNLFTNKAFTPPIHKESAPLNAEGLLNRGPGRNPFEDVSFRMALVEQSMDVMRTLENKIRRSVELQASQILQTGQVSLTDQNGAAVYSLDFKPKATHFPTAGTSWASATLAQKISDLTSLVNVIINDGLHTPTQMIFGEAAMENLLQTSGFLERLDNRRADLGSLQEFSSVGNGGIYQGKLRLGNYYFDIWSCNGRYKDPQTGNKVKYLDDGKVIIRSSDARMDATFGGIPNFNEIFPDSGSVIRLPELAPRVSSRGQRMDLHTNIWKTPNGEQIMVGVGSRPLMIPVAIDTYGCLTTQL